MWEDKGPDRKARSAAEPLDLTARTIAGALAERPRAPFAHRSVECLDAWTEGRRPGTACAARTGHTSLPDGPAPRYCPIDGVYRVAVAIRGVLLDLEGTLYSKGQSIPGAIAAVLGLRDLGLGLRFLTNTDSKSGTQILEELACYGLPLHPEELFTPVVAAQSLLAAVPDARVYALVSEGLRGSISSIAEKPPFTHVLVGDCRDTLNYSRLDEAFRALRSGAELVALQRGRYFKRTDGDHLDTGAVVAALEYAAALQAQVLGKPSPDFFGLAANGLGVDVTECVVVGDDATTDIAGGRAMGALTVQVRTGKYADQQAEGHEPAEHVIESVAALPALLERLSTACL